MPDARRQLGAAGEALVAQWYERAGWQVVDRNWRVKAGELDLVVARGRTRAFCEVKTRSSALFGSPAEAVTVVKQLRLRRLAAAWLAAHAVHGVDVRFDVASVLVDRAGRATIEVIEGAFGN